MASSQAKQAFGVFSNRQQVEGALAELKAIGFPMSEVSVINQQAQASVHDNQDAKEQAEQASNVGAIAGGAMGGTAGLLLGMGTAALIPGMGPLALVGAAAMTLATTLTSSVIGATAGSLLGALISYGIPEEQATLYSDRIKGGEYFVMLDGMDAEVRQAAEVLTRWHIQELRIYDSAALVG